MKIVHQEKCAFLIWNVKILKKVLERKIGLNY